jgi:hypothetical protein
VRDHHLVDLVAVMHVRPWETDDLTFADLCRLAEALGRMRREAPRG